MLFLQRVGGILLTFGISSILNDDYFIVKRILKWLLVNEIDRNSRSLIIILGKILI